METSGHPSLGLLLRQAEMSTRSNPSQSEISSCLDRIHQNGDPTLSQHPSYDQGTVKRPTVVDLGSELQTPGLPSGSQTDSFDYLLDDELFTMFISDITSLRPFQQSICRSDSKSQRHFLRGDVDHLKTVQRTRQYSVNAKNRYLCSYECLDRYGRVKCFKRSEHKSRHEKSVHQRDKFYNCWVPGCKSNPFSRADNLKAHLKNHGTKSPQKKLQYVATQDKQSEYYNADWVGVLTKEGYPVKLAVSPDCERSSGFGVRAMPMACLGRNRSASL